MQEFDYAGLVKAANVQAGETIDIVSDILDVMIECRKNKQNFSPDNLIDAFCNAVGLEGTILIRTFNWDFCNKSGWDYRNSKSQVGSLGNIALKRADFKRTRHPIYSWLVWGKNQEFLTSLDYKDSFGVNSIFNWERLNDVFIVSIGNPNTDGFTIIHHVEEMVDVPYRYVKDFTNNYTDENGNTSVKTYSMYVRNLDMDVSETKTLNLFPEVIEKGYQEVTSFENIKLTKTHLKGACEVFENEIRYNRSRKVLTYIGQND